MKQKYKKIDINLDLFYTSDSNEYIYKPCDFVNEDPLVHAKLFSLVGEENIEELKNVLQKHEYKECINFKENNGETCLHMAIFTNNLRICKLLLENGADINKTDKDGHTCVHRVIFSKCFEILDLLIKYGANINQSDSDGNTLLHLAVISKNNISNNYLYTPLDCALKNEEIIYLLQNIKTNG
jgi:hypothetical protein